MQTGYTVQLASMEEKRKAEKMIEKLLAGGYDAYFYEAEVKGKIFYRVRCGRFPTKAGARRHAQKLAKETGLKGFVSRIE